MSSDLLLRRIYINSHARIGLIDMSPFMLLPAHNYPRLKALAYRLCCLLLATAASLSAQRAGDEITFPADAYKMLDTFEALNLEDANKLYNQKDYKGAFAAYRAYSFEFPQSRSMSYVLLRMGRCLHQLEKRNAAIKAYQDVVNYFPDDVRYAAAALFHIGECHGQNGDVDKQTAVWARMVKDKDYVSQPNSGTALTHLGKAMEALGKHEEAAGYHWRTAVNFLNSNPRAAGDARDAVRFHYAVRSPNHEKLSQFYQEASDFEGRGRNLEDTGADPRYWSAVLNTVLKAAEGEALEKAAAYWTAKMGTRFEDNDDLRKLWCDAQLAHEKDPERWKSRLQTLYAAKPASLERVLQWCRYYSPVPELRSEFFAKEAGSLLSDLASGERMQLMNDLRGLRMDEEVRLVMRGFDTRGLSDEEIDRFVNFAAHYESEDVILRHINRMQDPLAATKARFDYYQSRSHRNPPFMEKALVEIPELKKSPKYAGQQLSWDEGRLLQGLGRYEEAIKAYRSSNREPDATWAIAECLERMKNYPEAIKTLREIESVGGNVASRASLEIAKVYRAAGDKAREVDQLRIVLRRYPESGESSEAHRTLENYGVALIGGQSEAND